MAKTRDTGWWRPMQSQKWHFFGFDGRSYCGKWMHMGAGAELQTGNDDSSDNCSACRAKRLKAIEREARANTP